MDFGIPVIWCGLAFSVGACIAYGLGWRRSARILFVGASLASAVAFFRLVWLLSTHQFQYRYVLDFSSTDLGAPFLQAAVWAGQEGSFLLWAVCMGIVGLPLAWFSGTWERRVMPIYTTVFVFLFAILTWLSPFRLVERGGPYGYPLNLPWPPTEGMGLNPMLQNYWMAIHPPVIFIGFAALAAPFAYAIAALWWRDHASFAVRALPWTLLAVSTLGLGKMIGGYWAYETQGWHGFWSWDPVENASLFPWLASVALLHGLLVQRTRGALARSNLFWAIAGWALWVYGTFLTRSGVLADFSMHAFVSLQSTALVLLLAMIAVHGGGGLVLLLARWRSVPAARSHSATISRDGAVLFVVPVLGLACAGTILGTSWPLISRWEVLQSIGLGALYAKDGAAVSQFIYNAAGSVLLVPLLLVMGAAPMLAWQRATPADQFLARVLASWMASIAIGFAILWYAVRGDGATAETGTPVWLVVLIVMLGSFATLTNLVAAVRVLRKVRASAGAWIAHAGIAMFFAGAIPTNVYEQTFSFWLTDTGTPVRTPFGYQVQYVGWTHEPLVERLRHTRDPAQLARYHAEIEDAWWQFEHGLRVRLVPDGPDGPREAQARTVRLPVFKNRQLALSQDPDRPQTMRWPHIRKEWLRDFYVLVADDPNVSRVGAELRPGQTAFLADAHRTSPYQVRYVRFEMAGNAGEQGTLMAAHLELIAPDGRRYPTRPAVRLGRAGLEPLDGTIAALDGSARLVGGVSATDRAVRVEFDLPESPPLVAVPIAVTNKPFINFVWLGVVLMGLGTFWAMPLRAREAALCERNVGP
ncbi:MAG TPA: cytochrome c biogenesis protein CcsA, partial [Chthonomonadales bacterium]|nr:cytochrome c biogenesis protein CcsA [Chthonomonadales bacterium]